ncbi:MAG: 16S rRNA (guanine(527)-N(7))-methyltransferase RsmG [Clostridia bacterium]
MKEDISFKIELYNEAKKYNYELNDNILDKLEKYKNLLLEWNEKINLTAITDEYEIIVKHFIDCLECTKYIKVTDKVIDVGTGAGFPGIVIAIFFEDKLQITLLDALNKRLLFLQEVIDKLQIKNVNIIHGRAEDIANEERCREKYDVVVARALAPLNILTEYTTPYLKVNGIAVYMKGDSYEEEILKSKNAFNILNLKLKSKNEYKLKINEEEIYNRYILQIQKIKNTSKNYPRSYGKIKKMPL